MDNLLEELWRRHCANVSWDVGSPEDKLFLACGAAGEVGELANLIKKVYRGNEVDRDRIREEIGDAVVYLSLLATIHNADLEDCVRLIMPKVRSKYKLRDGT
jgi:NTP pyrophosphatase (non-canonical NTP hydrolase)